VPTVECEDQHTGPPVHILIGTTMSHRPPQPAEHLWNVTEVARYLGVSRRTAADLIKQPGFPVRLLVGRGCHRWVPAEVRAWALTQRLGPVQGGQR
jgi:predicted DNA-binding transcriptional regulator AlpA